MEQMRTFDLGPHELWLVRDVHGLFGEEELVRMRGRQVPGSMGVHYTYELPDTEGLVYRSRLGLQNARYYVMRGSDLVRIDDRDVADLVDPAGKRRRDVAWQAHEAGLDVYGKPRRFCFSEPHDLKVGDPHVMKNGALAFVTKATKLQAWLRRATLEEIDEHERNLSPGHCDLLALAGP